MYMITGPAKKGMWVQTTPDHLIGTKTENLQFVTYIM